MTIGLKKDIFRRVEENAAKNNDGVYMVRRDDYKKLHGDYEKLHGDYDTLAIKYLKKFQPKYTRVRRERNVFRNILKELGERSTADKVTIKTLLIKWSTELRPADNEKSPRDEDAASLQKSTETPQAELSDRVSPLDVPLAIEENQTEDKDVVNQAEEECGDPVEDEKDSVAAASTSNNDSKVPRNDDEVVSCDEHQRSPDNVGSMATAALSNSDPKISHNDDKDHKMGSCANHQLPPANIHSVVAATILNSDSKVLNDKKYHKVVSSADHQRHPVNGASLAAATVSKSYSKVPRNAKKDRKAESWVNHQLPPANDGTIGRQSTAKFDSIRFAWQTKDGTGKKYSFQNYFVKLQQYESTFGDFNPLPNNPNLALPFLGEFAAFVRAEYEKFHNEQEAFISPEEIQQLDSIGFNWKVVDRKARRRHRSSLSLQSSASKKARVVSPCAEEDRHAEF